ncbi:NAD(P)/FAD-dependent oxidoreductase [Clostridium sp. cel8]|jgi:predicted Rossmann fold flavoprotein|uniref:NAD(P)/FAD-dependent oxidoreductase n=1 Tax=Clostridium sp. cel8 TaxID=2663123 RepID=UPI0015F468D2|nr:NAD(P)/FAD-dependent oxidoreductase [Clostridium sp. cel8]MBA5851940.1 NAD(P)/FAD-dependent oxidoreductase [Clostridium sp. cel8]
MAKVIVIGGGPAGMMAAITASKHNSTILLEKNEKLGKKMYISGKGRCNVTNAKDISEFFDYIPGNADFLYSSLYTFTNQDTIDFFNNLDVKLKVERGDRVFPVSDKSSDIIKAMEKSLHRNKVDIKLNSNVKEFLHKGNRIYAVKLSDGTIIKGDYFILATGGKSYPQTGSTGDGYRLAKSLGHSIEKLIPSLVPIEIYDSLVKKLQGLSLKNVELYIKNSHGKILYDEFGEMIFTHYGISGPIVLSGSRVVGENLHKDKLSAIIDLKPALSTEQLDKRIQKDFMEFSNKSFKNSLDKLLPKKMIPVIIEMSGIDPDKKVNSITKKERYNLVSNIKQFKLNIKGSRPIEEAIVTSGGVTTREINPSNMKSKLIDNLYFAGEVIDVDGYTGGFNIQIALSTGFSAGSGVDSK